MRIKKGFTLAEILIVLMVIGVIAMLTIPSMMKGVTEAQLKAGYKKAYNTIVNVAAMERIAGGLPTRTTAAQMEDFYESLVQNLSVKFFVPYGATGANTEGTKSKGQQTTACVVMSNNKTTLGTTGAGNCATASGTSKASYPWIVTDDGLAYTIDGYGSGTADCGTKAEINAQTSVGAAITKACLAVVVDVNGLSKGPNTFEMQRKADGGSYGPNVASSGYSMTQLTGDDYYIYVGLDGATSGSPSNTVTGRIVSDLK